MWLSKGDLIKCGQSTVAVVHSLDLKPLQTLTALLAKFVFANYTLTDPRLQP